MKLGRVLINTEWDISFAQTNATAISYVTSNNTPVQVDFNIHVPACKLFRFEKHWLVNEEVKSIMQHSWSGSTRAARAYSIFNLARGYQKLGPG